MKWVEVCTVRPEEHTGCPGAGVPGGGEQWDGGTKNEPESSVRASSIFRCRAIFSTLG